MVLLVLVKGVFVIGDFLYNTLGFIRPSQELIEYYRCKIAEYDSEYENLMEKLEKYKSAYEHLVIQNPTLFA